MAMTAQVKAELATIKVAKPCCRKSEVAATLRFAGGLHIVGGRIVIEAELDTGAAARRLGIVAKAREVRNVDRVVIRDGDAIAALLTRLGAHESLLAWEDRRMRREVRASANRLANFDDANLRRSARAAVAAGARVERALEILGDDVPEHLRAAGVLRVENKQASLEELGQLHDPPLTKDAVAGRIRRLLATADKRAAELGIASTEANLSEDLLEQVD
jgi:cell division protein WhiA